MSELRSSGLGFGAGWAALPEKAPARAAARSGGLGGPPRLPGDYAEIFGGFQAACSIPVLDLPPLPLAGGRSSGGVDYAEMFGGFRGGGFELSYDDLVAEAGRTPPEALSEQRAPKEAEFDQQEFEVSKFPSEGFHEDDVGYSERDQIASNFHSVYDRKQSHTLLDNQSQKIKVDPVNGTADLSQSHASCGSMFNVDACSPSHNTKNEHLPNKVVSDLHLHGDVKVERASTSSSDSAQVFENDSKEVQLQSATKYPASEIGPAKLKKHSRSSSYHSTSSRDISNPDYTFFTISDISLRTRPLKMPPPSRPPPRLDSKQVPSNLTVEADSKVDLDEASLFKDTTYHPTDDKGGTYKNPVLQEESEELLRHFYDVEVDGSSAAAASAAAMKEAMKQAEARLKSAKELMERKKDVLQSRKSDHHDKEYEKRKANRSLQHVRSFSADMSQKTTLKEGQQVNATFIEKRQESMEQPNIVSDLTERKTYLASAENVKVTSERKKRSSQMLYKFDNGNGKWREDQQFYELLNYEEKLKMVPDIPDQKGFEQKPTSIKTSADNENRNQVQHDLGTAWQATDHECFSGKAKVITEANYDKGNRSEVVRMAHDCTMDTKPHAGNDACELDNNAIKNRVGVTVGREEEIKEILNEVPEVCVFEENKYKLEESLEFCSQEDDGHNLERAPNSNQQRETAKKLIGNEEVHGCADEERSSAVAVEEARACKDKNKELTVSGVTSVLEEVHQREDEDKKRVAGKEGYGCMKSGKELNTAFENFEAVNVEVTVPYGSGLCSMREKRKAAQDASPSIENEKTGEPGQHSYNHEVNEDKSIALEPDYSNIFNGFPEPCESMKYEEPSIQVTEEDLVLEENKKFKAAQKAVEDTENTRKLEADKLTCQQEQIEKESGEVQLEYQQNQKKHNITPVLFETEKCENRQKADENKQEPQANSHIKEVKVAIKGIDISQDFGQRIKNKDLKSANLDASLGEKKNKTSQALEAIDRPLTRSAENAVTDMQNEDKMERRKERESEQEKELARKLEEEKEREREREKDRLATATCEGRAKAERIAEGRLRALAEAREKAERASSEAVEKSLAERATKEARLRAERAAVERATAEARERAAEKAASEARKHVERSTSLSKDGLKKDNEAEGIFGTSCQEDSRTRTKATVMSDGSHDAQFQSSYQRHSGSHNHEGESALRRKARLERHQRTVERAAKALAEKNMRDMLAQREQAERNRLAEFLDADVRRWSTGKEGNLRALISTLQYILGPDSGWQPIPLTEVITAAAVKRAYRKATLCVHPDKLQQRGATIQQKYVCEKVFDLLKDAWNQFNSEER